MKKGLVSFFHYQKAVFPKVFTTVAVFLGFIGFSALQFSQGFAYGSVPFKPVSSCVEAPGGINCINVRTWAARRNPATAPTAILLDGLRARWDKSGWEIMTNVQYLADRGVNVVEPVGGESSFYTDWNTPSKYNNQPYTYKWESFLSENLPAYLDTLGFSRNYTILGISMGGSAAVTLTAHHPNVFRRAGSISGFLHLTSPGFADLIRIALLTQNGYDLTAMWGPTNSSQWYQNDPYMLIPALRNKPLWIGAGPGVPTEEDRRAAFIDTFNGVFIEMSAKTSATDFKQKADTYGLTKAHYFFPEGGVHTWWYWQHQVWAMLGNGFFTQN